MRRRRVCALALVLLLCGGGAPARADDASTELPTADEVLDTLKGTLAWYQQTRAVAMAAREAGIVVTVRESEPATRVVQQAFEVARAQAAALAQPDDAASTNGATPAARRAARRTAIQAAIHDGERELARLRERKRAAAASRRAAIGREITGVEQRLAVDRLRLELLASVEQAEASLGTSEPGLTEQIQALQEAVPEVAASAAQSRPASAQPAATTAVPAPATETWGIVRRLLALRRAHGQVAHLEEETGALLRAVDVQAEATRTIVRDLTVRLRGQVSGAAGDRAATEDFGHELERLKRLAAIAVPLRTEAVLLQRFDNELQIWRRTIDRESRKGLQDLVVGLAGVAVALVLIGVGALVWRLAAERYVQDPYRRRLVLRARRIVSIAAVVLVLVFHFTNELTALVTALGFAAAGIAFALQNVILSVAGYFSMMSPHGIRLGDRVSLQGPFGYVHGEVLEIGLVRIRLRELGGDTLEPTGRVVEFPNSVVFTGSFFKDPPARAKAA
jgi:hypothetical protein